MGIIPKKLLEWREPKDVTRWRSDQEMQELRPILWRTTALLFGSIPPAIALIWWLEADEPLAMSVRFAVGMTVFAGALFLIPKTNLLYPYRIQIHERGVMAGNGRPGQIPRKNLRQASLTQRRIGSKVWPILRLDTARGRSLEYGLPETTPAPDELRQAFAAIQVPFVESATSPAPH